MKKITLLHTVASVYGFFADQLMQAIGPDCEINSIVDEFLATNAKKKGCFPPENRRKLYLDLVSASLENPDVVVVTCSTLTPIVKEFASSFDMPLVTIDERMCLDAVHAGGKLALLATAASATGPTEDTLRLAAQKEGVKVEVSTFLDEEAMALLNKGDAKGHDQRLERLASSLEGFDAVVFAQASMATAAKAVSEATGLRVFTAPSSCICQVAEILAGKR